MAHAVSEPTDARVSTRMEVVPVVGSNHGPRQWAMRTSCVTDNLELVDVTVADFTLARYGENPPANALTHPPRVLEPIDSIPISDTRQSKRIRRG